MSEFNVCIRFFKESDGYGSLMWTFSRNKFLSFVIEVSDNNINLEEKLKS